MLWAVLSPISFLQEWPCTRATFRKSKRAGCVQHSGAWSRVNAEIRKRQHYLDIWPLPCL